MWFNSYIGDRVVDVAISRLREKIEDNPSKPQYILTKRGVGYHFKWCGYNSIGRILRCQRKGYGFESRYPLQKNGYVPSVDIRSKRKLFNKKGIEKIFKKKYNVYITIDR